MKFSNKAPTAMRLCKEHKWQQSVHKTTKKVLNGKLNRREPPVVRSWRRPKDGMKDDTGTIFDTEEWKPEHWLIRDNWQKKLRQSKVSGRFGLTSQIRQWHSTKSFFNDGVDNTTCYVSYTSIIIYIAVTEFVNIRTPYLYSLLDNTVYNLC